MFHVKHRLFFKWKVLDFKVFVYVILQHSFDTVFQCHLGHHAAGTCSFEFYIDFVSFESDKFYVSEARRVVLLPTQDYTTKRAKISRQISLNFKNKFKNSLKLEKISKSQRKNFANFHSKKMGRNYLIYFKKH